MPYITEEWIFELEIVKREKVIERIIILSKDIEIKYKVLSRIVFLSMWKSNNKCLAVQSLFDLYIPSILKDTIGKVTCIKFQPYHRWHVYVHIHVYLYIFLSYIPNTSLMENKAYYQDVLAYK